MNKNLRTLLILLLLFVLWITPGLFGRDPWKADEPYSFGVVSEMIRTGDLVMPSLTGELFLEKPPVFFITASLFGWLLSPPLELYDAARIATALFMFLAILFLALAARELYGKDRMALAVVLLLGCVHLQVTAHKLITDVALFAGLSAGLYGLALCVRSPRAGGFWLGTGVGLGFLSKGMLAPGMLGVTALLLPVLFEQWRKREYFLSLAVALAAALPWLVIWPALVYQRSPELFVQWFWHQNFGRFLGGPYAGTAGFNPGAPDSHSYYIRNLIWLGWPVVLPALWSLWHFRRSWRHHSLFQVPLVAFVVLIGVLSVSSTNRTLYAVPMVLPLVLLAVPGIEFLPQRAKVIGNRAALFLFGVIALLLWIGWHSMMAGMPEAFALRLREFQPDYTPSVNAVLLAAALFYTAAWLFMVIRVTRAAEYVMINWTLGIVLVWALIMTLWLPALNTGSSYRAAFLSLKNTLPENYSCVASIGLGESERAMLDYYAGLRTRRIEIGGGFGDCDLLLEQRPGKSTFSLVSAEWRKTWEFRHPSVRPKDLFCLYVKKKPVRSDRASTPGNRKS
jgi:4-amino-4-deoxy-L-arabinose transferase-like glycosyltransferase